jgi:hypothetical protein
MEIEKRCSNCESWKYESIYGNESYGQYRYGRCDSGINLYAEEHVCVAYKERKKEDVERLVDIILSKRNFWDIACMENRIRFAVRTVLEDNKVKR